MNEDPRSAGIGVVPDPLERIELDGRDWEPPRRSAREDLAPNAEPARRPTKALQRRPERPKPARVVSARVPLRRRVREIWRSRELFAFLVRKELKVKYKNSTLGFLWSLLNPALVLAVYYVVFTIFLKSSIPKFALFLFAGLLAWNLFNTATMGASGTIVGNSAIVKKVAFPREILPLSQVGTASVFFLFQAGVMTLFLIGFRIQPAWGFFPILLLALVALIAFSAALAVFLSALNVYLRDTQHLIEVLLQAWFWGTPIVYSFLSVQGELQRHPPFLWIYLSDPLTPIVLGFQRALYGGVSGVVAGSKVSSIVTNANKAAVAAAHGSTPVTLTPSVGVIPNYSMEWYALALGAVLVGSLLLLVGSLIFFGRVEGNFAEEL
jgi:ABC-2 type transport system permease protein